MTSRCHGHRFDYTRRGFLKSLGACAALATAPRLVSAGDRSKKRRPNFVFILIDDMGWRDVGFMGNAIIETPNLDRLARRGIVFTNAYANAPNCAPTRACLMSGQYPPRHGVYTVGDSTRGSKARHKLIPIPNREAMPTCVVTIAEALKPAGYTSACIGMWNLGRSRDREHTPLGQGFDVYLTPKDMGYSDKPPDSQKRSTAGPSLGYFANARGRKGNRDPKPGEYLTDRLTDEAIEFMKRNRERSFFLYLAHHAVHRPHQPKPELLAKHEKKPGNGGRYGALYAAMVESVDQSVGRIMAALDSLNLTDNTVVIFSSDNGGDTGAGVGSNAPLRGGKGMVYEGGIRVPTLLSYPHLVKRGRTCDTPVLSMDFYPTMLELAGVRNPTDHILDGESLVPLLNGTGSLKRDAIFFHFPCYLGKQGPAGAIRQGDFKLIESFEDGRLELYNLERDIGEKSNLAQSMPKKARELRQHLTAWRKSVKAPVPTEPNPDYDPNARRGRGRRRRR